MRNDRREAIIDELGRLRAAVRAGLDDPARSPSLLGSLMLLSSSLDHEIAEVASLPPLGADEDAMARFREAVDETHQRIETARSSSDIDNAGEKLRADLATLLPSTREPAV